jgi:Delta7-sterol 5-desaturase
MYDHPLGRRLNTSIYHNQHHESFHGNYSLYFTFWDRWCGTLREDSALKKEQVHRRIRELAA